MIVIRPHSPEARMRFSDDSTSERMLCARETLNRRSWSCACDMGLGVEALQSAGPRRRRKASRKGVCQQMSTRRAGLPRAPTPRSLRPQPVHPPHRQLAPPPIGGQSLAAIIEMQLSRAPRGSFGAVLAWPEPGPRVARGEQALQLEALEPRASSIISQRATAATSAYLNLFCAMRTAWHVPSGWILYGPGSSPGRAETLLSLVGAYRIPLLKFYVRLFVRCARPRGSERA